MEKSESLKEIGKALMLFHTKMEKIKKDSTNPFFGKKYASLSTILENIQLPMNEAGLSFSQLPDGDCLVTILIHYESGEYFQSSYNIHPSKTDPQGIGSAITYARRYAISAILGLNVDDDDDGNAASVPEQKQSSEKPQGKKEFPDDNRPWLSEKMYESAKARIGNGEDDLMEKLNITYRMKKEYREGLKKVHDQITVA